MDHEERFASLESTLAFQDRALRELSDVVVRQQARIERLEAQVKDALDRPGTLVRDAAHEEPPPHY